MNKGIKQYGDMVLIKGCTGSGKTGKLQERYQQLLDSGERADRILVLVRNRRQSLLWRNNVKPKAVSGMKIQSFFGFIQGEIKKYWPVINNSIAGFKKGMSEPVFLTTEVSQLLLTSFVDEFRNSGKLADITASSQKIAIEGLGNLARAAAAGLDSSAISGRLIGTCSNRAAGRDRLLIEFQELLDYYIRACKENGYIDYSLAIKIYSGILSQNELYNKRLKDDIKHLIVDGLEDVIPCEADFIGKVIELCESCMLSYSTDDTYSRRQGACPEYAESVVMPGITQVVELDRSFTCGMDYSKLSDAVFRRLEKWETPDGLLSCEASALEVIQGELRSEVIKKAGDRILQLMKEGYKPGDIAVICPIVDSVMEYCLSSALKRTGINVSDISRTNKYMDESSIKALITLACLCHPHWEINPHEHDISNFVGMVLGLDPVRSALIAREVVSLKPFALPELEKLELRERVGFHNSSKYNFLKDWIEDYRKTGNVPVDAFFQNAFITILLDLPRAETYINSCRLLIESAATFIKTMGTKYKGDLGKAFVEMVRQGVKPVETIQDLERKMYSEDMVIATPQAYLSSSLNRKVQIWMDAASHLWHRSDVEELSNPYVFSPVWKDGEVWTEELDEKYKILKCGVLAKRLMRRCPDMIILAESQYNQDGYENDGVLSEAIKEACANPGIYRP